MRWLLDPLVEERVLYLPLFLALIPLSFMISALAYAVAALAGVLATHILLVQPRGDLSISDPAEAVAMILALLVAAGFALFSWEWHRLTQQALDAAAKASAAEQALQDADRNKDEFIATLAHELRGPLNSIALAVQKLTLRHSTAIHAILSRASD